MHTKVSISPDDNSCIFNIDGLLEEKIYYISLWKEKLTRSEERIFIGFIDAETHILSLEVAREFYKKLGELLDE